jgi:hypothetical protein
MFGWPTLITYRLLILDIFSPTYIIPVHLHYEIFLDTPDNEVTNCSDLKNC